MKQVIIALGFLAFSSIGANAQVQRHCGIDKDYVCHKCGQTADCYKTDYSQNYPVCKGPNGYYICCSKDAGKKRGVNDKLATEPTTEKHTVVYERSGNITSCYEISRTRTAYIGPTNTD